MGSFRQEDLAFEVHAGPTSTKLVIGYDISPSFPYDPEMVADK